MSAIGIGLRLGLSLAAHLIGVSAGAAEVGPSIVGISEGARIGLSESRTSTNLAVAARGVPATVTQVVFELERQGTLTRRWTSPPPFEVTLGNLGTGKFFLALVLDSGTGSVSAADISFDIGSAPGRPINDRWAEATPIEALGTTVTGHNSGATREALEPLHAGAGGGQSVWWSWVSAVNGVVTATTTGSGFDTVLALYTGARMEELRVVDGNDDVGTNRFSQVEFKATAGVRYYFAVDGVVSASGETESGSIRLSLVASAAPRITITDPLDGVTLVVASPTGRSEVPVRASVAGSSAVERVQLGLGGPSGSIGHGLTGAPYEWNLAGLACGDYVLTAEAVDRAGLVGTARAGFSVTSIAPEILWEAWPGSGTSGFRFVVSGLRGATYSLESSTNLPVWHRLNTWTNFTGIQRVTEDDAAKPKARWFRVQSP